MSFVPPPPPGVVVPQAPAATPAKIVKPGGVALDMSDLFGPPKTGGKKALPPWERKRKTPPPGNPTQSKDGPLGDGTATKVTTSTPTTTAKTSPPVPASAPPSALPGAANRLVFRSTAETSYPSLSSLPTAQPAETTAASAGPNAPVAVTRKSVPTVALSASQAHSTAPPPPPPLPATSMLSSAVPAATTTTTTAVAPPPSLPQVVSLPAVVPAPATAGAVAHSASAPAAGGPLVAPLPTYPASLAVAPAPLPASVVGGAPPAAAGASNTQAAPPLPGSDPAAVAASAHIVEAALRDMRMHLATPSHTVVAPHVVFQGREQKVSVMPLGPVPPRKETRKKGAAPTSTSPLSSSDVWWNAYDLRPSPSWTPAQHPAQSTPRRAAAAGPTKRDGRGAYFQNVDVHRYIARRYFGEPAPVEH